MASSDFTTFCIYRIVCFASGDVYVGQTNAAKTRKNGHFGKLKQNKHHNQHLQDSFNKYGQQSFYFEVIEKDLSVDSIDEREMYWIAHFNSYHNGFNQTEGSGGGQYGNGTPCEWNGVQYPTVAAAARSNHITLAAMQGRLKRGHVCDADLQPRTHPVIWNDTNYPSIRAAATANKVQWSAMQRRIVRGRQSDGDKQRDKTCVWNGIVYASLSEAARSNNVDKSTMCQRIGKGFTCDDDIKGRWGNR